MDPASVFWTLLWIVVGLAIGRYANTSTEKGKGEERRK